MAAAAINTSFTKLMQYFAECFCCGSALCDVFECLDIVVLHFVTLNCIKYFKICSLLKKNTLSNYIIIQWSCLNEAPGMVE